MTEGGAPKAEASLTDEEILKRAEMINEARKFEEGEKIRQLEEENAARAGEAKRIKRQQEAEAPKKKKHTGLRVFIAIILVLFIICGIVVVSYNMTSNPATETAMPYSTAYTLWFPQGTSNFLGLDLRVMGDASQMMITMPGSPTVTVKQGQLFTIEPKKFVISFFWGGWKIVDLTYKVTMTYMGISNDNFVTINAVFTSNQVIPEWILNLVPGIKYAKA